MPRRLFRAAAAFLGAVVGIVLVAPPVLVGLTAWTAVGGARWLARLSRGSYEPSRRLYDFDPQLGWKPKAHLDTRYLARGDDICRLRTDSEGWAGRGTLEDAEVVALGDSFVFGYGIDADESFTQLGLSPRVKPVGAPGYSMVQGLLLLHHLAPRLRKKIVVWFVCLDNDLYDNLRPHKPNYYRSPFVRATFARADSEWEIVTDHLRPEPWTVSSDSASYYKALAKLCCPNALSDRAYGACRYLIREAHQICRSVDADLAVGTIPNKHQLSRDGKRLLASNLNSQEERSTFDPAYPDLRLSEVCRELGVPFSAGREILSARDYKAYDAHWTPAGHGRAAEWLAEIIRRAQTSRTEPGPKEPSIGSATFKAAVGYADNR